MGTSSVAEMAVVMVDLCQALQEAKNAIAAKMGGGWPCVEKMDLTCIRHKSISHVQGVMWVGRGFPARVKSSGLLY